MNKDQVKGAIEETKGKVKQVTGKLVGNKGPDAANAAACDAARDDSASAVDHARRGDCAVSDAPANDALNKPRPVSNV